MTGFLQIYVKVVTGTLCFSEISLVLKMRQPYRAHQFYIIFDSWGPLYQLCHASPALNPVKYCLRAFILWLMKDSIPQNEKHRMCISSRDLNYARNNLCELIKNDVEFCRNLTDFFCFIHERIVTHIMVLGSRNNILYETLV